MSDVAPLPGYQRCDNPRCEANLMPLNPDGTRGYRHAHPEGSTWQADRDPSWCNACGGPCSDAPPDARVISRPGCLRERCLRRASVEGMGVVTVREGEPMALVGWWRRRFGGADR